MRPGASALALVCALAGCGARADLEVAFGHALRDVRIVKDPSWRETFIVGRIKEDVPYGFARSLPWEGRWVPFAAQLDGDSVRWIRELPEMRELPIVARAWGGVALGTMADDHESFVSTNVPFLSEPRCWPGHWPVGCNE
jgi:hypothetical protein